MPYYEELSYKTKLLVENKPVERFKEEFLKFIDEYDYNLLGPVTIEDKSIIIDCILKLNGRHSLDFIKNLQTFLETNNITTIYSTIKPKQ